MSSFHKAVESRHCLTGTKIKNNLPYVSSGIPSLDHVIGGGIHSSTIFVVEEDILGTYSKILNKYFIAEGVVCNHALLIASADGNPQDIVKELPVPCKASADDEVNVLSQGTDKMKIAWRYEGLAPVESSFGSNSNFGHNFDLSKNIDKDTIDKSNITYWTPTNDNQSKCKGFKNYIYYDLLKKIKDTVSKEQYQESNKNKNILRISINSLGSPLWMAMDCEEESSSYGSDLLKFLYCLRVILRDTTAVTFITVPTHLFDDHILERRLLHSVDNAVRLESFAGSSKETNPMYKDYHGLFHIEKLSATHTLVPFVPPSIDLAFKLRRKKFIIEKLHLPPELQDSSEREQDDITAVPTCGGFKKKDIDF